VGAVVVAGLVVAAAVVAGVVVLVPEALPEEEAAADPDEEGAELPPPFKQLEEAVVWACQSKVDTITGSKNLHPAWIVTGADEATAPVESRMLRPILVSSHGVRQNAG